MPRPRGLMALLRRRGERCWNEHLRLLVYRPFAALGWPGRQFHRLLTNTLPRCQVSVCPDMHPAIQPTDVTRHTPGNRRELGALGQRFFPGIEHFRHSSRRIRVDTHLIDVAQLLAATQGWRKGGRDPDFRLHVEDELLYFGRPARYLGRLRTQVSTMLEILVFPDVNNLIQGPYLSVPEGRQGRDFDTLRQCFAKILLGLPHCTGFQRIGAKCVDTHRAVLSLANLRLPRRFYTEPELPSAVLYAPRGRESKYVRAMPAMLHFEIKVARRWLHTNVSTRGGLARPGAVVVGASCRGHGGNERK